MAGDADAVVAGALRAAFGDEVAAWEHVGGPRSMDFSGSTICELRCSLREAPAAQLLVLKRTSKRLPALPADAPEAERLRAERTDFSYQNECAFIRAHAEALAARGCAVPRPLHVATGESFLVLMEALSPSLGWEQHVVIPAGAETAAALRWLARFHAAFLPGGGALPAAEGTWAEGRHMSLEKRPASELARLPETLAAFCEAFAAQEPHFGTAGARALGPRLQAVAADVARHLSCGEGGAQRPTVVHGDYKSANVFFRRGDAGLEVSVIDWQWAGPGVAATDLYALCALALSDEAVEDYEASVLRPYHAELAAVLGSPETYPYDELVREWKLSALDFLRWLSGARLAGFTPEKMAAAAVKVDINVGIWRRSARRMAWIWRTAEESIEDAELGRLYPREGASAPDGNL